MNKTSIEWCDYTLNPVKGKCPMGCSYCYARKLYDRFKWNPEIRYEPTVMCGLADVPDGSRVFWGSTIELFHDSIPQYALAQIFEVCRIQDNLIHIFLTKQPQNLVKFSPFPDNCWVGVTATDQAMVLEATNHLYCHRIARMQFLSIEPLLSWDTSHFSRPLSDNISKLDIDWLIIGAQTQPYKPPKIEWVREIVEAADRAGIPVFLKDNLNPLFAKNNCEGFEQCKSQLFTITDNFPTRYHLRQEMPDGSKEVS